MILMLYADLFDFLDQHQGASTAILTFALVAVTIFYALQNRKMVREMKKARDAAVLPKLALDMHALGPNLFDLAIKNVGPGAALDIDVRTEWVPIDESASPPGARWRRNVMASGEQVELFPPDKRSGGMESMPDIYEEVRLLGEMRDAVGNRHQVDERFEELPEWGQLVKEAQQSWKPPEPERRAAEAMHKKFDQPLKSLTKAADEIARAIREVKSDGR